MTAPAGDSSPEPRAPEAAGGAPRANMTDPVCKMNVDPAKAAAQSTYKSQTYYFCAVGCKQKFDREPEKYLAGGSSPMGGVPGR
jgi:YHS domain-containing protein